MQATGPPTVMRMLSLLHHTALEVTRVAVVLDKHIQKKIHVSTACVDKLNARAEILQCPGSSYFFLKPAGSCCHEYVLLRSPFSCVHSQVKESLLFWCFVLEQTAVEAASCRDNCSWCEAWLGMFSLTFPAPDKPVGKGRALWKRGSCCCRGGEDRADSACIAQRLSCHASHTAWNILVCCLGQLRLLELLCFSLIS